MPDHAANPAAPEAAVPFFWWCATCGRVTPFGYDQLGLFARDGWPDCCGERVLGCLAGTVVPSLGIGR